MTIERVASPLVLAVLAGSAVAQACPVGAVFEHPGLTSIPGIEAFLTADADSDGNTDLIVVGPGSIAVHLNDGAGALSAPVLTPIGVAFDRYLTAHAGDIDGDGDTDLVLCQPGYGEAPRRIEVYENTGAGSFAMLQSVPIDPSVEIVLVRDASGDFNGDGLPDLLITEDSFNHRVLLNDQGLLGGVAWDLPPLPESVPLTPEMFDQNNDGIADIFLSSSHLTGTVYTVRSTGSGLGPLVESPADIYASSNKATHFFDFDSDGYTDYLFASPTNDYATQGGVGFGKPDGGFEAPSYIPGLYRFDIEQAVEDPESPAGSPAWFIRSRAQATGLATVQRFGYDAARTLTAEELVDTEGERLLGDIVTAGDFDGDGASDLLLLDSVLDVTRVYRHAAGGGYETDPTPSPYRVFPVARADFNADGVTDVVFRTGLAPGGESLLRVALSDGVSGYELPGSAFHERLTDAPVALVDLNGDGIKDFATSAFATATEPRNPVVFALGAADGTFGPLTRLATTWNAESVAAGDLNADGHIDLFAVANNRDLAVFYGAGDGTFGAEQLLTMPNAGVDFRDAALAAGDLDGDGMDDVVVSIAGGANRGWVYWHDETPGQFTSFTQFNASRPDAQRIDDLDGDGMPEILLGTALPDPRFEVGRVLWNNGDRSFALDPLAASHDRVIPVGDLDGDGIRDAVGLGSFAIYESGGSPSFGDPALVLGFPGIDAHAGAIENAHDATAADIDLDGDLDLLFAVDGVAIVLNQGNGFYQYAGVYEEGFDRDARAVIAGDFNSDGMPDAALVYPRLATVRLNQCSPPSPCPADVAPPAGVLDLADIGAFVSGFVAADPIADLDPDGVFDLADITAFIASFNAGCP